MIAVLKTMVGPTIGSWGFLATTSFSVSNVGAIVGVASLFGAFAIVARYREALAVAEKESAIYTARDMRMTQENHHLTEKVHELESRPNLASHAALLKTMSDALFEHNRQAMEEGKARAARDERIIVLLDQVVERDGRISELLDRLIQAA